MICNRCKLESKALTEQGLCKVCAADPPKTETVTFGVQTNFASEHQARAAEITRLFKERYQAGQTTAKESAMYERFTDRARKVMQLANQEAQRLNHEHIGTEHILLGLVKEGTGMAAIVLKNLGLSVDAIGGAVMKFVQCGPDMVTMGRLPQTPTAKRSIELAIEEARGLQHNYIGTEHLLLGLLRLEDGVASNVLRECGVQIETVRREILNLLGHNLAQASAKPDRHFDVRQVGACPFKPGDIVQLKSGGPQMTVGEFEVKTGWLLCAWFNERQEFDFNRFPPQALKNV